MAPLVHAERCIAGSRACGTGSAWDAPSENDPDEESASGGIRSVRNRLSLRSGPGGTDRGAPRRAEPRIDHAREQRVPGVVIVLFVPAQTEFLSEVMTHRKGPRHVRTTRRKAHAQFSTPCVDCVPVRFNLEPGLKDLSQVPAGLFEIGKVGNSLAPIVESLLRAL